jgi:tagaturonate reductase
MIAYFKGEWEGKAINCKMINGYSISTKKMEACDGRPISIYQLVEKVLSLEKVWKQDLNQVPN